MKIKSIELNNIRSHKSSRINFKDGVTILSGRTGSGKSSFLLSIEYALFGADVNLTNNMMLKRNTREGYVKLVFTESGMEYEVVRGLIKKGRNLTVNPDKLWIKKGGVKLPIISRSSEVNEKILKILQYPSDVKPKELFEVTSYAKQDEIRKLIEMTSENRQKYIDRVLQLSKYQLTWENLKELINELRNKLANLKGLTDSLPRIIDEYESRNRELKQKQATLKEVNEELKKINDESKKFKDAFLKKKEELEKALKSDNEFKQVKALINELRIQEKDFKSEIKEIRTELLSYAELKEVNVKELIRKQAMLNQEKLMIKDLIRTLQKELLNINELKGKCPLCKQEINEEHRQEIKEEYHSRMERESIKLDKLSSELRLLNEELSRVRIIEEELSRKKSLQNGLSSKKKSLNQLKSRIKSLLKRKDGIKTATDLDELRKEYEELINNDKKLSSELSALKEKHGILNNLVNELRVELKERKELIKNLSEKEDEIGLLEKNLSFITRVREDIRNIREVVRARFLEDFRAEFQKKYEEIRGEDDYVMEIQTNYEPIAYSGGIGAPINTLSGGEKTSVALAYRLALAEVAATVSDVARSELLILDEPTYGFDRDDIKALPQALRSIKTIPQMIIVSHEDELKSSADYKYQVNKRAGVSEVKLLD